MDIEREMQEFAERLMKRLELAIMDKRLDEIRRENGYRKRLFKRTKKTLK
jgi:hypothetical protein